MARRAASRDGLLAEGQVAGNLSTRFCRKEIESPLLPTPRITVCSLYSRRLSSSLISPPLRLH